MFFGILIGIYIGAFLTLLVLSNFELFRFLFLCKWFISILENKGGRKLDG